MVIFNSYVKLPEGRHDDSENLRGQSPKWLMMVNLMMLEYHG